jgi:hypothetical protein
MSENNTILQTIIVEAQKQQLRLDSYIELLQNTYVEYKNMINSPEVMLSRICFLTCSCIKNNERKDPIQHEAACPYRHLYGI